MLAIMLLFMGQFALFTYLRPFLETVTGVSVSTLSLILLVVGVAGLLGTYLIGSVLAAGLYRALIAIPLGMAAIAIALTALGGWPLGVAVLLGGWGLIGTPAPVGLGDLARQDAAGGGRGGRRADGRGHPAGHHPGRVRGRVPVRRERLPQHLRPQRRPVVRVGPPGVRRLACRITR